MKIGIIGCGLIGGKRADAALQCGWTVPIVCDVNDARANALAAKVKGIAVKDWHDVVAADVDVINIALTHDLLPQVTLAALNAGKHVLVEKPAGRNAAEVKPIVELAKKLGKVVKVGFNHRFHPAMLKAKAMVEAGDIGPLMYVRGRYGHGGRPGYEKEWRVQPEISGGGELVDQGSHLIDLSRWYMGDLKLDYAALPKAYWNTPVEDNCFLSLKSPAGQIAWLHASWSEWKNTFSLEIYGKVGKLTIDGLGGSYGTERLTFHKMLPELGPPETTIWEYPFPDKSWQVEFNEFAAAMAEGRRPVGDIEDAYEMLRIVDQAYGRE
jgi:predicted dehydrogenase